MEKFLPIMEEVYLSNELSDAEKLLLPLLYSLSIKEGVCRASNNYLALCTKWNISKVKRTLSKLKEHKQIKSTVIRDDRMVITERKIKVLNKSYNFKSLKGLCNE